MNRRLVQPLTIGLVAVLVGFSSSFAVVLAGLRAVGADTAQAASGLTILCVAQGLGTIYLSWRHRIPITLAWSTPGAALLATQGYVTGGWPAAIGAFMVTGALLVVTGLWGRLGKLVAAIPVSIAQAMLAGVLLPLCVAPFRALAVDPWLVAPVIVTWVVLMAFAKRWATPAAFGLALVLILVSVGRDGALTWAAPALSFTSPTLTFAAIVSIAVPLYVVTMASQNVPGAAVMASAGYTIPWRESLLVTGAATMAGAPAGGHAVNLAAITAALPASPEADPDPARRWIASSATGWGYVVLAPAVATLTVLVAAAPPGLVEAVAGLALLATLATALAGALKHEHDRLPSAITFVVSASGLVLGGVGSAFWALVAGLVVRQLMALAGGKRQA